MKQTLLIITALMLIVGCGSSEKEPEKEPIDDETETIVKESIVKSFATSVIAGVQIDFTKQLVSSLSGTPTYVDGAQAASVQDAVLSSFSSSWFCEQAAPVGGQAITLFTFIEDTDYKVYYATNTDNTAFIVTRKLATFNDAVKVGGTGLLKAADAIGIDGNTFP